MPPFQIQENETDIPTIHVVSDSVGMTAQGIARAAASQGRLFAVVRLTAETAALRAACAGMSASITLA